MSALDEFRQKWCNPDYPAEPVSASELERIGFRLGFAFPPDYVAQITATGAVHTTLGLLHVIVETESELYNLSELHTASDILENTEGWRSAGMPTQLVAIGSDAGGNSFCFDMREQASPQHKSRAIYLWDHDFDETIQVAASFTSWIESYLKLPGNFDSWKDDDTE